MIKLISKCKWIGLEGHVKAGQIFFANEGRARDLIQAGKAEIYVSPTEKKTVLNAPLASVSAPVAPASQKKILISFDTPT